MLTIRCEGQFPVFAAGPAVAGYTYEFYINGTQQTVGVTTNTSTPVGGFVIRIMLLYE